MKAPQAGSLEQLRPHFIDPAYMETYLLDIIISSCQTISSLCSPAWSPWPPPWSPCPPHPRQWWGRQAFCTPGHAPQLTGRLTNKVRKMVLIMDFFGSDINCFMFP